MMNRNEILTESFDTDTIKDSTYSYTDTTEDFKKDHDNNPIKNREYDNNNNILFDIIIILRSLN